MPYLPIGVRSHAGTCGIDWTGCAEQRNSEEETVKTIVSLIVATYLMSACVAGSTISHEDSPAAVQRDAGPALCRDGSTPPCVSRD
jgi:hypothetical protein